MGRLMNNVSLTVVFVMFLTACVHQPATDLPHSAAGALPPSADRDAILGMAGEYDVRFAFDETVVLREGYLRKEAKRSGAAELVLVVENSPERIMLQHLLVMGESVVKHWRQDWVWQAPTRLEFVADQTWQSVALTPEETSGRWTQCVYEVSDAPRYCGTGVWNHRYGQATWTSDRTWRPLPRREYTTRDDYNALNVKNRHTVVPGGWTHEQDNSKVERSATQPLSVIVREFGFNDYRRTDAIDFTPAYAYWEETASFWAQVRDTWQAHFARGGVVLETAVDGMPIIDGLFTLADERRESGLPIPQARIDTVFDSYVRAAP